jgi:hypothetical protein
MKRIATTLLLSVCIAGGMQAQSLKQLGTSVDDIVPQGWSHYEVTGDLNKDGLADLAVMTATSATATSPSLRCTSPRPTES